MNFEDLKEQLQEKIKEISSKISESESFIQLAERYKNLSPNVQKLLVGFGFFMFAYVLYSIPAAYVDSSKELEANFSESRDLIRGLFRSARSPSISSESFRGQSFQQMKMQVEGILTAAQVLPTQKGRFTPAVRPLPGKVVPGAIQQDGMTFEVKKLNLRQVVNISERVSSMHPNTKLANVDIRADASDPHYFNVTYTLSSLSLPIKEETSSPAMRR